MLNLKIVTLSSCLSLALQLAANAEAAAPLPAKQRVDTQSVEYKSIEVPKDFDGRASDLMHLQPELQKISDNIYMAYGTGNIFLIKTPEGNVIFDTGVSWQADKQREMLLSVGHEKTTHIVVSHAHGDHIGGLMAWKGDIDKGTELVAHSRYPYTNKIYTDTAKYLWSERAASIYPRPEGANDTLKTLQMARKLEPTKLVNPYESYRFEVGGVKFEVIAMQNGAEGEDNLVLWLPEQEVLFTGDLFGPLYPMVPNLYTVRGEKVRDPLGYIETLDHLIRLEPSLMLPSHFGPIEGKNYIHKTLTVTRDGTEYVYNETAKGMNAGKTVYELMESIKLPESLEISQGHGKVAWNVRTIWELLAGWFYFQDVADLYPIPPQSIYPDIVDLAGGQRSLVERARQYRAKGKNIEALRLLDVAKSTGQETQGAIELRVAIYTDLLEESEHSHDNVSLDDFLKALLENAKAQLK